MRNIIKNCGGTKARSMHSSSSGSHAIYTSSYKCSLANSLASVFLRHPDGRNDDLTSWVSKMMDARRALLTDGQVLTDHWEHDLIETAFQLDEHGNVLTPPDVSPAARSIILDELDDIDGIVSVETAKTTSRVRLLRSGQVGK